jgi:hypothetical protein
MKTMNCNKAKAMVFTPEEIAVLEKAELVLRHQNKRGEKKQQK